MLFVMRLLGGKMQLGIVSGKRIALSLADGDERDARHGWEPAIHRTALYHVYGLFDRIKRSAEKGADERIIKQIIDGDLMGDDPRFAFIRDGGKSRSDDGKPVILKKSDSSWFRDSNTGAFIVAESKFLPRFRDEMQRRVTERQKGLSSIFKD
jgi:hypothetical protein